MSTTSLKNLFQEYTKTIKREEDLPHGFWTTVSDYWSQLEGEEHLSNNAVRKRFKRRLNKNHYEVGEELSDIDEKIKNQDPNEVSDSKDTKEYVVDIDEGVKEKLSDVKKEEWIYSEDYIFDEKKKTYLVYSKNAKKHLSIPEEVMGQMKKAYSDWDGEPSTINQIARTFGLPRKWFHDVKTVMGWTHDSEPFTDRDVDKYEVDHLVDRALENKKRSLYSKFENKSIEQDRADAEKWRHLDHFFIKPIIEKIESSIQPFEPSLVNINLNKQEPYSLFFAPFDLHIGKLAYDKTSLACIDDENSVIRVVENLFSNILRHGKPEKIITACGSDFFHFDNELLMTTRGTPQGAQSHSNLFDTVLNGYNIAYKIWDFLLSLGIPVDTNIVRGNHDKLLSLTTALALQQRYNGVDNMTIHIDRENRQYAKYGRNLIGMTHGESLSNSKNKRQLDITKSMLIDARKHKIDTLDVENYIFFSGHKHQRYYTETEDGGVIDITLPSLSVTDVWHHENVYEGNKRVLGAYRIHRDHGYKGCEFEPID